MLAKAKTAQKAEALVVGPRRVSARREKIQRSITPMGQPTRHISSDRRIAQFGMPIPGKTRVAKSNRSPAKMKIAYERASRCAVTGFTGKCVGLTRIRRHFAIYFCLHRGKFGGKHYKLASEIGRMVKPI